MGSRAGEDLFGPEGAQLLPKYGCSSPNPWDGAQGISFLLLTPLHKCLFPFRKPLQTSCCSVLGDGAEDCLHPLGWAWQEGRGKGGYSHSHRPGSGAFCV